MPKKVTGVSTEGVSVSLKSNLLFLGDQLAEVMDLNRSSLMNQALKSFIKQNIDRLDPKFLNKLYQVVTDE